MNKINNNIPRATFQTKIHQRENIELLRHRVNLLDGKDKLLMLMYLDNGNSFRQIARLLGVCEATIGRRIHKLIKHLTGQPFQTYRQYRKRLNREQKDIAKDYFLIGLSIQQIASKRKCSYYRVRTKLKEIQAIIKANEKPDLSNAHSIICQKKRIEVKNGNIQYFKKLYVAGNNNRQGRIGLQDVRLNSRKTSRK